MIKKKLFTISFMLFFIQCLFPQFVFAESSYVLPYPSFMPGTSLYKFHIILESIERYWYFGSFGQFIYNQRESDKYLVESKTLFEYKQYLLAMQALEKSDHYFIQANRWLSKAGLEGKDITEKRKIFQNAAKKHGEVLKETKKQVPQAFIWSPEKDKPKELLLWQTLDAAIAIRERCI